MAPRKKTTRKKAPKKETFWQKLDRWWGRIALTVGLLLMVLAFVVGGNLISQVSDQQDLNNAQQDQIAAIAIKANAAALESERAICDIAKIVPAPQTATETNADFAMRVRSYRAAKNAIRHIDCKAVLRLPEPSSVFEGTHSSKKIFAPQSNPVITQPGSSHAPPSSSHHQPTTHTPAPGGTGGNGGNGGNGGGSQGGTGGSGNGNSGPVGNTVKNITDTVNGAVNGVNNTANSVVKGLCQTLPLTC